MLKSCALVRKLNVVVLVWVPVFTSTEIERESGEEPKCSMSLKLDEREAQTPPKREKTWSSSKTETAAPDTGDLPVTLETLADLVCVHVVCIIVFHILSQKF